jgi:hypothetical protein
MRLAAWLATAGLLQVILSVAIQEGIPTAHAQPFGISALLNPEGSRLFPQSLLYPRHPRKPDPRWRSFEWRFVDHSVGKTKYRLYLYEAEDWTARFAIPRINSAVQDLSRIFSYTPSREFSYILFTSQREFRQANVFDISEGVQGITSTQEATMAIPYWGEAQTFDHVSAHEMVHQFQVQKINDLAGEFAPERMTGFPLWFIEGMAEYYSLHGTMRGVDPESLVYLRDLLLNPDPKRDYSVPKFFEEGPLNFIFVYKIGQAKLAFLESYFGPGTAQRILSHVAKSYIPSENTFQQLLVEEVKVPAEKIEEAWRGYLAGFKEGAEKYPQKFSETKPIPGLSENLPDTMDYFDLSPNEQLMIEREMDPLTGVSSIHLLDLLRQGEKHSLVEDNRPDALTLFFSQSQTLAIADNQVAYIVETASGPELETRAIHRHPDGDLKIGDPVRIKLHELKVLEVTSVALSPDGGSVALVDVTPDGAANLVVIEGLPSIPDEMPVKKLDLKLRRLTQGHYSWKNLYWNSEGILAAGDRTPNGRYGIFRIHPVTGKVEVLTTPEQNQFSPSRTAEGILIQSWADGSPQAQLLTGSSVKQITSLPTGIFYPRLRNHHLYGLVFHSGRYRLARFEIKTYSSAPLPEVQPDLPWKPQLASLDANEVKTYRPFMSQGSRRLDNFGAFLASGGYFGVSGIASDLMRDYTLSGEFLMLGNISRTTASVFFSGRKGRTKWTVGGYREILPMIDNIFTTEPGVRIYSHREFGVLGAAEYPFNPFTFADLELRLSSVSRGDFSDRKLREAWESLNPGTELLLAPTIRFGYDRLIYEAYSGPLKGFGLLLEAETSFFPGRNAFSERLRMDISNYWHLPGRTVFMMQGIATTTWGDRYRNSFFVSSDDILRAYPFNDERLYGNNLLAGKSELRFPIGSLFGFPPLRGLAAYDIGSIFNRTRDFSPQLSSSVTGGITLNLPPLSINFMISRPIREAPGPMDRTVGHFTLRYLYL